MVRQIRGRKATILSKEKEAAVAKALEAGRLAPCCVTCGLWSSCRTYHMKPDGDKDTAEILFIGEAPGADEDAVGRPFMGKSGTLLRNALAHNSVTNFVMDNAVKCRPVNNTTPTMKHVKSCFPYTQDLIYSMPNLKLIVPVGNIALRALTGELGILGKSGKQFSWQNFKMMPLIHPASVLRQSGSLKDFHDHVARIPNILRGDLVSESDFGNYIMIASLDTWRELVNKIKERKLFVYDVETNGLNQFGADFKLKGISFSVEPREAYWLEWHLPVMSEEVYTEILADMQEIFESPEILKCGQNIKFDNLCVQAYFGWVVKGTHWDTKISQYCLHPTESNHLKDMAWSATKCGGYENALEVPVQDAEGEVLGRYSCTDSDITHRVMVAHKAEMKRSENAELEFAYHNLMIPASEVLTAMEYNGIMVDPPRLARATQEVDGVLDSIIKDINRQKSVIDFKRSSDEEFNPQSHVQLRTLLFKYEGLAPVKMTEKTKQPSTDKEVLKMYEDSSELCRLLVRFSDYGTMKKTFLKELFEYLSLDHTIHTNYWLTETFTGRTSSRRPNLQNIPKGDKDVLGIRKAFIPNPGFLLAEFDFNQHELRVMADESRDSALRLALEGDVHTATASSLLGIPASDVTSEQRRLIGKVFNFGLIYGMTPHGLVRRLKCSDTEAQQYLSRFFGTYQNVRKWMDETAEFLKANGYVKIRSGFKKYIYTTDTYSDHDIRLAWNTPIQGLAGHILLYAAIGVQKSLTRLKAKSFLSLEVHDSLVMNVHRSELGIIPEIKEIMLEYFKPFIPSFEVPLQVDVSIGDTWGDLEKVK